MSPLVVAFVSWLAAVLAHYVRSEYSAENPAVHSAPPSLKRRADSARTYTVVAPEAAWDLMERAHQARANIEQAIALKDDADELGCGQASGYRWQVKKTNVVPGQSANLHAGTSLESSGRSRAPFISRMSCQRLVFLAIGSGVLSTLSIFDSREVSVDTRL